MVQRGLSRRRWYIPHNHRHETRLLDLKKLDVEDESAVAGDAREGLAAVRHAGGDRKAPLAADGHAKDADVPALDDLALADLEAERLALLVGCAKIVLTPFKLWRGSSIRTYHRTASRSGACRYTSSRRYRRSSRSCPGRSSGRQR